MVSSKYPGTSRSENPIKPVTRIATGIQGFDELSYGGLPEHRTTLVVGTSGSCKTIFTLQCVWNRLTKFNSNVVLISFEQKTEMLLRDVVNLGWDLTKYIDEGRLFVVDASPTRIGPVDDLHVDLGGLLAQVSHAVDEVDADFVAFDAMGTLLMQMPSDQDIRSDLNRMSEHLAARGCTTIINSERLHEYGLISRYGIEEFVADAVVILRNVLDEERVRRTVQILKLRGDDHLKGEFPFTFGDDGLVMLPLIANTLTHSSSVDRITSGSKDIDKIAGGGFFQDSIILISGATGTGKTLLSSTFAAAGCLAGERTLFLAYEESLPQLQRNAEGWGMDLNSWEAAGVLKVIATYPEALAFEDHLVGIRRAIEEFKPKRLVVDSLSALERVGTLKVFREFVIGLSTLVKQGNICTLLTSTSPSLSGGESITEAHISTLTDAIVVLRYVETGSRLRRGIGVIKMRGSAHDKTVHEYNIGSKGIEIMEPFQGVNGIILGLQQSVDITEDADLQEVFQP